MAGLVSLWLLRSSLADVYGEIGDVAHVDARWLAAIVASEVVAFTATWELNRLALRTHRWVDVAVAQLAGNAANNVVPAGGPVGAAVQLGVLTRAGFDMTAAATSLGALSILGALGLLSLPLIALPFALAGHSDKRLEPALWLGVGLLIAVLVTGMVFATRDAPLAGVARFVQWVQNHARPSRLKRVDLPARVLAERDSIRSEFAERPVAVALGAVGRSGGDCLALYLSLVAVGAHPSPVAVLATFAAANVAGMVPFTPGGLGFVEAGITATLVTAGVSSEQAVMAAAVYRLASTWLPSALGLCAYILFRWRHRDRGKLRDALRTPVAVRTVADRAAEPVVATLAAGLVKDAARPPGLLRRRLTMLAISAVALVLLGPVLVKVYERVPDVVSLRPVWLVAIGIAVAVHFVSGWAMYRIVLRTSGWFDVAASQLASNAASHVTPAGSAVGAGMQLRMLTIAGFPASRAATALGTATVLGTVAGYIVLPVAVLIGGLFGNAVAPRLIGAMLVGTAVLIGLLVAVVGFAARDEPWRWVARRVTSIRHRFHRAGDAEELATRLIGERDAMRQVLRSRAPLVVLLVLAQPLADYVALYLALLAVGAHVNPAAALAAFIVSNVAGLIPFTPGGLGFVEAGLTGVLTLAGAARPTARLAVVTYRLAATWLPSIAGALALATFHHRHSKHPRAPSLAQVD